MFYKICTTCVIFSNIQTNFKMFGFSIAPIRNIFFFCFCNIECFRFWAYTLLKKGIGIYWFHNDVGFVCGFQSNIRVWVYITQMHTHIYVFILCRQYVYSCMCIANDNRSSMNFISLFQILNFFFIKW